MIIRYLMSKNLINHIFNNQPYVTSFKIIYHDYIDYACRSMYVIVLG